MKHLSAYLREGQTEIIEENGVFFAFNREQLREGVKEGIKYVRMPHGMFCPKENAEKVLQQLDENYKQAIQKDLEENGIEKIIKRDLNNYECYYSGDWMQVYNPDYGMTSEQVEKIYLEELPQQTHL